MGETGRLIEERRKERGYSYATLQERSTVSGQQNYVSASRFEQIVKEGVTKNPSRGAIRGIADAIHVVEPTIKRAVAVDLGLVELIEDDPDTLMVADRMRAATPEQRRERSSVQSGHGARSLYLQGIRGSLSDPCRKHDAPRAHNSPPRRTVMADRWDLLTAAFARSLRARNRSERTVEVYTEAIARLADHLLEEGVHDPAEITRTHVEGFLLAQFDRGLAPATVSVRYRGLQQWFKWMEAEEIIPADPMRHMSPPSLPERLVPVLTDEQLRALLAACAGKGFTERRDEALMRVFHDTGCRRGEVVGMRVDTLDQDERVAVVIGKGNRERPVFYGAKTAAALDRYLLVRAKHPQRDLPALWLGTRGGGALTAAGLRQVFRRRGAQAGIEGLHPHQLRHTWASTWLQSGGTETDLMNMAGWRSRQMLNRYGASAAAARAREAHRRLALGDRL